MGKRSKRISTEGNEQSLESNPFGGLDMGNLPDSKPLPIEKIIAEPKIEKKKSRGRVDVIRQRSAGGAGWMTVAKNFVGISKEEKNDLKKQIQKRCGVGGALKDGMIEIQGDKREDVKAVLEKARFRVIYAGG